MVGFLYLAIVMDAFSRRVVGWSMANHLRAELVLEALNMAIWQRSPDSVIHHSDQGTQYTSIAFGKAVPSTPRASLDRVSSRLLRQRPGRELLRDARDGVTVRERFKSQAEARMAVFEFIEGFYNPRRRHSALDNVSPIVYERRYSETRSSAVETAVSMQIASRSAQPLGSRSAAPTGSHRTTATTSNPSVQLSTETG